MKMLLLKKFSVHHFPSICLNIWLVSLLFCLVVFVSHLYKLFCGLVPYLVAKFQARRPAEMLPTVSGTFINPNFVYSH